MYKLPHNLNQNFLKIQTKKKIKLLARIIYYIMFACVLHLFYQAIRQNTTKSNTIIGINFVVVCRMARLFLSATFFFVFLLLYFIMLPRLGLRLTWVSKDSNDYPFRREDSIKVLSNEVRL